MVGATKMGKCVICGTKCKERREFQPQLKLFEGKPTTGIPLEMCERIKAWRDEPLLCEEHAPYRADLRKVKVPSHA